ncbi:ABC transporter substrate-binding protein [Aeromicrobium sp. UC242_57]|uniref:ABC transporter substrate-binding protein n=1 Tax=Aeromicrobium sp. UC242_57 TaxID=3374624 RepID=UPI0037B60C50
MPGSLKKIKVGSAIGAGTSHAPVLALWLEANGGDIKNVEFVQIPSADIGTAMENGAVDMGYIGAPFDRQFKDSDSIEFVTPQISVDAQSVVLFGSSMLKDNPEVGQAILRAAARTSRDHLKDGYKQDPTTVKALAKAFKTTDDAIKSGPPLTWGSDLQIGYQLEGAPAGTPEYLDLIQQVFASVGGVIDYTKPLTKADVYDTSFADAVMGR